MVDLDLMELADLSRPKEIAKEIVKQNPNIRLPVPLEDIAEKAGIRDIVYEPLDSIEGALIANDTKSEGIIVVNNKVRHQRQRFTLGHELGHFLLPRHGFLMECTAKDLVARHGKSISSEMKIEFEANEFSAEMIMPQQLFKLQPEFRAAPSINNIIKLSLLFDVSFEACARRYLELHDDQIAMVFSHNNIIRYGWCGGEIPFWLNANKGNSIPFNSATQKQDFSNTNSIAAYEVDSNIWFGSHRSWVLPETLIEEVYVQENCYSATLLWIENEIEEIE